MNRGEKVKKGPSSAEMQLINLRYDLTPCKYLSMIVCEIGNIPPHSVPVVIREILDYEEDRSSEGELFSDDESSIEELEESLEMREQDVEEDMPSDEEVTNSKE